MSEASKSCPELLREAANLIDEALRKASQAPASQRQQVPVATSRHTPVQGGVAKPLSHAPKREIRRTVSPTDLKFGT
ncbi:hypothetical protein CRENBAI_007395 [Crenichthys baileyi]|uniref:Uncharacterized protein n=1 Tax=Crenichthys baileyi TaxID=28760 RepID=A0AAV9S197_9TELE